MSALPKLFATCPLGLEPLLATELRALGAQATEETRSGVHFRGDLALAYRACLWSRLANRILLPIARFPAESPDQLYAGVRTIDWNEHIERDGCLAVDFTSHRSKMDHELFGAQKVKDAIVDQFKEGFGARPNVRLLQPDIRVNTYLDRDEATVSLDLSGDSLHRRGYRLSGSAAPLKENLAAAILIRGGWPEVAKSGGDLLDPMCGSGTLLIEGALLAGDVAPGLARAYFGFLGWKQHDPIQWEKLRAEAEARRTTGLQRLPRIMGYDIDREAVRSAWQNIERAGLRGFIHIERKSLRNVRPQAAQGLMVVNPPYGERLGETEQLKHLYVELGETIQEYFQGWRLTVLTGNPELAFKLGIRAQRYYALYNGAIPCRLFNFEVTAEKYFTPKSEGAMDESQRKLRTLLRRSRHIQVLTESGQMLANRLRKNLRHFDRWARQNGISCYRVYDADLPEYAVSVDLYRGSELWVHVQEYQAPSTIDPEQAEQRLVEAVAAVREVVQVSPDHLFLKIRRRHRGQAQYEKQAETGHLLEVEESGYRFWVNLSDYLDTGLFLDHRLTRQLIRELAAGKHFLNLFAYTASATVYAAKGGASSTTSVDLSNTYLDWAARNLESNDIRGPKHRLVRSDVLAWLDGARKERRRYGLIFLDPPTFSHSKNMAGTFDVQRDHVGVLREVAALLEPRGILIFSTNAQRFKVNRDALPDLAIEDISRRTIPKDFERNPRIHQCWKIEGRG